MATSRLTQNLYFNKITAYFTCTVKFKKHCLKAKLVGDHNLQGNVKKKKMYSQTLTQLRDGARESHFLILPGDSKVLSS